MKKLLLGKLACLFYFKGASKSPKKGTQVVTDFLKQYFQNKYM